MTIPTVPWLQVEHVLGAGRGGEVKPERLHSQAGAGLQKRQVDADLALPFAAYHPRSFTLSSFRTHFDPSSTTTVPRCPTWVAADKTRMASSGTTKPGVVRHGKDRARQQPHVGGGRRSWRESTRANIEG